MRRWLSGLVFLLGCGPRAGDAPPPPARTADRIATAAPRVAARGFTCGEEGQPPCPMQRWMRTTMTQANASGDPQALALALDFVARRPPPGMPAWSSIAEEGARAARSGEVDRAKTSCKTCHATYKARYRAELRDRAF